MEQQGIEIAPDGAPATVAERPAARALGVLRGLGPARLAAPGAVALALLGQLQLLAVASMGCRENPRRLEVALNSLLPPARRLNLCG